MNALANAAPAQLVAVVLISYEHAGLPAQTAPGKCMHVFTLKGGMIQTLDWATFFGGTP